MKNRIGRTLLTSLGQVKFLPGYPDEVGRTFMSQVPSFPSGPRGVFGSSLHPFRMRGRTRVLSRSLEFTFFYKSHLRDRWRSEPTWDKKVRDPAISFREAQEKDQFTVVLYFNQRASWWGDVVERLIANLWYFPGIS